MCLAAFFVLFQRVLQLVCLRFRSTDFKELEIVEPSSRARGPAQAGWTAGISGVRPIVLGGGESAVAARRANPVSGTRHRLGGGEGGYRKASVTSASDAAQSRQTVQPADELVRTRPNLVHHLTRFSEIS